MRGTRYLTMVAAASTLLAAAPLSAIFDRWTWAVQSFLTVGVLAGIALLTRALRAPVWAQLIALTGGLLGVLTWMFPSGAELLAVLPTPGTFAHFGALMSASVQDIRNLGVPVNDTDALLFITVLGIGAVAIVVDQLTVNLHRPALAGLPMLAIYSVPVAVHFDSVPPLSFVVATAGYLWLLGVDNVDRVRRFGRRFTSDGRGVSGWEPSPLAAAGRRLAVVGVGLAVLVPLVVPGTGDGLLAAFGRPGGDGTGSGRGGGPGRVDLFAALSGQLNQSEIRDLVKVTTDERDPFYLRFGVADQVGAEGFGARSPSGRPVTRPLPDPRDRVEAGVSRQRFRASVEVTDRFVMPLLPTYAEPIATDGLDSSWLYDPAAQIIFSNRSQSTNKKYSFEYVRSRYSPQVLDRARPLAADDPIRQQFTSVPPVREVRDLVARLTERKESDYAKVRAIYDYFSHDNGFSYSLRTEGGTSGQDIVNFLTNKVGFCQQYAAGMAWLVRAAGIPARVAFGFTNGTNRQGGAYVLTNRNLHAWTEVYFGGIGWVPFDATPAASVPGSLRSAWAPDVDAPDPVDPSAAPSAGPGSDASSGGADSERRDRDPDAGLVDSGGPAQEQPFTRSWWVVVGLALLLGLMAAPALRRVLLRRRRHLRTRSVAVRAAASAEAGPGVARVVATEPEIERARADAHAAWDELIDTLVDFRVPIDPSETPRATADRLAVRVLRGEPGADDVRLLGRAEERARYARDPLPGSPLAAALHSVRRGLVRQADRRTRVTAVLLPPSVLRRWRAATLDGYARLVAGAGRTRGRLERWSPWRLIAGRFAR